MTEGEHLRRQLMALSAADESWRVPRLLAVGSGLEYLGAQRCGITSRMASDMPAVKLVVMLRDPVERAFSAYQHEFARGYDSGRKPHWVRRAR
jgi:hypothetical protein